MQTKIINKIDYTACKQFFDNYIIVESIVGEYNDTYDINIAVIKNDLYEIKDFFINHAVKDNWDKTGFFINIDDEDWFIHFTQDNLDSFKLLENSARSTKDCGKTNFELCWGSNKTNVNCNSMLALVAKVNEYLYECATQSNNAVQAINEATTIDEVLSVKYRGIYPEALVFNIKNGYVYLNDKKLTIEDSIAGDYNQSKMYVQNEYCSYEGKYYRFILEQGEGIIPTNSTYWQEISVSDELNRLQNEINNLKN